MKWVKKGKNYINVVLKNDKIFMNLWCLYYIICMYFYNLSSFFINYAQYIV